MSSPQKESGSTPRGTPTKKSADNKSQKPSSFPSPVLNFPVPLGIGTMMWGTTWLDKKVNGYLLTNAAIDDIITTANKAGITFIDTAEGYGGGTCEVSIQKSLARLEKTTTSQEKDDTTSTTKNAVASISRNMFVATKFLPTIWRYTEASFLRALDHSNKRLGMTCSPLYFIHSPVHPRALEVWVRAAGKAVKQGKMKYLGLSNFNADQVRRAYKEASKCGVTIAANQLMVNLLVWNSPKLQETLQVCREYGILIIGYAPLGQGLLTDHLTPTRAKGIRLSRMTQLKYNELDPLRAVIQEIAEAHGSGDENKNSASTNTTSKSATATSSDADNAAAPNGTTAAGTGGALPPRRSGCSMSHVVLNFLLANGVVPLVGIRKKEQLEDVLGCLKWKMSGEEVEKLNKVAFSRHTFEKKGLRRSIWVVFVSLLMLAYKFSATFIY